MELFQKLDLQVLTEEGILYSKAARLTDSLPEFTASKALISLKSSYCL
jgi:hypothetical protein